MSSAKLPFGRSETHKWKGGTARLVITGDFQSAKGVSTSVELSHRGFNADGSFARGTTLRTFNGPGEYMVNVPPGEFWFWSSGPDTAHLEQELNNDGTTSIRAGSDQAAHAMGYSCSEHGVVGPRLRIVVVDPTRRPTDFSVREDFPC